MTSDATASQTGSTGAAPGGGSRMFASLAVRNYRYYFFGQSISVAGNWMQTVAAGWVTLELTNDPVMLGLIFAARYVPILLLAPWGGLVADRVEKLRLLILTQAASFLLTGLLGVLALTRSLTIGGMFVLVTLLGLINVFDGPSRQSLISNLVPRELLANAIALNSISMNVARVLGPALGGLIIAGLGSALCFLANAASFVIVIVLLLRMDRSELRDVVRAGKAKGQIVEGLRHAVRTPELLLPLLLVALTGIFTWEYPVSLPLLTTNAFAQGAEAFGLALASLGLGCVIGGFLAARRATPDTWSLSRTALWWGLATIALGFAPTLWSAYLLLLPVGIFAVTFNSSAKTVLQLTAPPQMRGRMMSLWSMGWQGSTVVGAPLIGYVGATLGPRWSLWAGGLAAGVFGVGALIWYRAWSSRRAASEALPADRTAAGGETDT